MALFINLLLFVTFSASVFNSENLVYANEYEGFRQVPMVDSSPPNSDNLTSSNTTSSLDNVEFDEVPEKKPIQNSRFDAVITHGVQKMAEIYEECSRKIDKRIEYLLSWRLTNRRSVEDLLELKEYVQLLYRCLKVQSFRHFDSIIAEEVIPLSEQVELVRDQNGRHFSSENYLKGRISSEYVNDVVNSDWSTLLLERLSRLLGSHSMKFHLDQNGIQGRGRRREYKMFAMMVMGFMIMASILIPMGFQFLTVLGGKSLLMAKMALIMSAINGLKKIATTPVGYGFYHSAPEGHHDHHIHGHHGFHDKLMKVGFKPDNDNFI